VSSTVKGVSDHAATISHGTVWVFVVTPIAIITVIAVVTGIAKKETKRWAVEQRISVIGIVIRISVVRIVRRRVVHVVGIWISRRRAGSHRSW